MKRMIAIFGMLLMFSFSCVVANTSHIETMNAEQSRIVATVKKTEKFIQENGIKKAIIVFRDSSNIFIGNYHGVFFISPLHPELIGKKQLNYKDPSGSLVIQEEVSKAQAGGGWLNGRWRENPLTGKYQCRKIYILPVGKNYFIGSWYHYSSKRKGVCSF